MNNFKLMGVINITPNSFSDGGEIKTAEDFARRFDYLIRAGASCIDIGAESTAPFNDSIEITEERSRFEKFVLPYFDNKTLDESVAISIDTYRPNIFAQMYQHIKRINPRIHVIWNDVSGCIDSESIEVLHQCKECDYVFSHCLVPNRQETGQHMQYVLEGRTQDCVSSVVQFFSSSLALLEKYQLHERVILDPCFGFSKNFEQNWQLIGQLPALINSFSKYQRWLLGISRKSFLKKLIEPSLGEELSQTEYLQSSLLFYWMQHLAESDIMIRIHNPAVFSMANKSWSMINCSCNK